MTSANSPRVATTPPAGRLARAQRSRVSNGRDLFVSPTDARSREARRFRDVYGDLLEHAGGDARISEARRHLVKRATALIVWCEIVEAKLANGEALDTQAYNGACNTLRRLLSDIGLDRAIKDVTPRLGDYVQGRA